MFELFLLPFLATLAACEKRKTRLSSYTNKNKQFPTFDACATANPGTSEQNRMKKIKEKFGSKTFPHFSKALEGDIVLSLGDIKNLVKG